MFQEVKLLSNRSKTHFLQCLCVEIFTVLYMYYAEMWSCLVSFFVTPFNWGPWRIITFCKEENIRRPSSQKYFLLPEIIWPTLCHLQLRSLSGLSRPNKTKFPSSGWSWSSLFSVFFFSILWLFAKDNVWQERKINYQQQKNIPE